MSGSQKGTHGAGRIATARSMAWQSMRILKRFSVPDLLRTVPEAKAGTIGRWLRQLALHGYVRSHGWTGTQGTPGSHQVWCLIRGQDAPEPPRFLAVGVIARRRGNPPRTPTSDEKWADDELRRLLMEFEAMGWSDEVQDQHASVGRPRWSYERLDGPGLGNTRPLEDSDRR